MFDVKSIRVQGRLVLNDVTQNSQSARKLSHYSLSNQSQQLVQTIN